MQRQDVIFFCHNAEQLLSCLASHIAKMWSATSTPEKTGLARDLRVLEFLVNLSNLVRLMRIIDQKYSSCQEPNPLGISILSIFGPFGFHHGSTRIMAHPPAEITLRGSTETVVEFFGYAINSILYQRGSKTDVDNVENSLKRWVLWADDAFWNFLVGKWGILQKPSRTICFWEESGHIPIISQCSIQLIDVRVYPAEHFTSVPKYGLQLVCMAVWARARFAAA